MVILIGASWREICPMRCFEQHTIDVHNINLVGNDTKNLEVSLLEGLSYEKAWQNS
jgi:hypothetical protein